MKKLIGIVAAFFALTLAAGPAHALSVSLASLGGGQGCTDAACSSSTLAWSLSTGNGTGTLDLAGTTLTFSITLPSSTFLPAGGSDNGVTQLVFSDVTYDGSATVADYGGGVFYIAGGSATVSGTQTPSGAGSAGAFTASANLSGSCLASGELGTVFCGIVFGPNSDFDIAINGATRYFTHTLNVTGTWQVLLGAEPGPQGHFKYTFKMKQPKGVVYSAD